MYEAGQIFAYEIKGNSAVIWRCFSRDTKADIPEQVEGYPVAEIAPYAFSAHMGGDEIRSGLDSGRLRMYVPELFRGKLPGDFPELCGERLEEVMLPPSVRRVGRYCFYNCGHLHGITFYGGLSDWGSGVFTGCHQVKRLRVYTDTEGRSYLKEVLDELRESLQVEYYVRQTPEGDYKCTKLVFPEFYEEGVENTPARILETRVHGSGIRYRNCFNGRRFDFHQYDVLFPHARAQEAPEIVGRLAMNRLWYPLDLTEQAREQYEAYAADHGEKLADLLLRERDMEGIRWLLGLTEQRAGQDRKAVITLLDYLTEGASGLHLAEILSFLMDYRRRHSPNPGKRKRLEL